jgi:hypothetical protein
MSPIPNTVLTTANAFKIDEKLPGTGVPLFCGGVYPLSIAK